MRTKLGIYLSASLLAVFAVACSGGEDGQDGTPGQDGDQVTIVELDEGHDVCEQGGQKILVGHELTDDGDVDEEANSTSIHYVCDGTSGDNLYVEKHEFDADDADFHCDTAGVHFIFGTSIENGVIPDDHIVEEATICNGEDGDDVTASVTDVEDAPECDGATGQEISFSVGDAELASMVICDGVDGMDGADGTDGVDGDDGTDGCTALIDVGADTVDGDGRTCRTVDTSYVDPDGNACDDNTFSTNSFEVCDGRSVLVEDEVIDAGETACGGNGGYEYTFGYDTTDDGQIDEIVSQTNICNGEDGTDGDGSGDGGDAPTITAEVTEVTEHQDCNDGSATELYFEADGTQISDTIVICDGTDGTDGTDGCTPELTITSADATLCPAGGFTTTTEYPGANCDDVDAPAPYTVCNGEDGDDGCGDILTWETIQESDADGMAACPYGGKEVTITMSDYNSEAGICELGDVRDTFFICDGADATDTCQLVPFGYCEDEDFTDPDGEFADLNGDLSNLSLRYIDFSGATLDEVDLTNSDLTGAKLNGASFENAAFTDAEFAGVDFSGANLGGTGNFSETDMATATFDVDTTCPDRSSASFDGSNYTCSDDQLDICVLLPGGDCSGFSLCGQTISEDLTGVDLSGTEMRGVNMQGSTLTDATLDDTMFGPGTCDGDTFGGADLEGVAIDNVSAINADFVDTQLHNTTLEDSVLVGADFTDATITGDVSFLNADATNTTFTNAALNGADFSDVQLMDTDFTNATLGGGASFEGAQAENAIFATAILDDSTFSGAWLVNTDFSEASITGAVSFENVDATDATFDDATLDGANFTDAILVDALFSGAQAPGSHFDFVDASGANFNNANLDGSSFMQVWVEWATFAAATLTGGVSFEDSNIRNADFSDAELQDANFDGVVVTEPGGTIGTHPVDTSFAGADFGTGASFWNADLRHSTFANAESTGAVDLSEGDLLGAIFTAVNLPNVDFTDTRLNGVDFVDAVVPNLIGSGADFYQANFTDATVTDAFFDPIVEVDAGSVTYLFADLRGVIFDGADLSGSHLEYADLGGIGASFENATLVDVDFRGATDLDNASGATWGNTLCPDFSLNTDNQGDVCTTVAASTACRLLPDGSCNSGHIDGLDSDDLLFGLRNRHVPGIDLSDASLEGANLSDSVLDDADFVDTDIRNANFTNASLIEAVFDGARLAGTNYTSTALDNAVFTNISNANGTVFTNAEVVFTEFTHSSFLNIDFNFIAIGADFTGTTLNNVEFTNSVDIDDQPENRVNGFIFDDVTFSGNIDLGPQHFSGVSMENAAFVPSFSLEFGVSSFTDDSDLTGMCGIDSTDVEDVTFDDTTICPDGNFASGGDCTMIPSC